LFDSDRPDEAAKPEIPCAGVAEFLLPCPPDRSLRFGDATHGRCRSSHGLRAM